MPHTEKCTSGRWPGLTDRQRIWDLFWVWKKSRFRWRTLWIKKITDWRSQDPKACLCYSANIHLLFRVSPSMTEYWWDNVRILNGPYQKVQQIYEEETGCIRTTWRTLTQTTFWHYFLKKLWELLTHIKLVDMTVACSGWLLGWCYAVGANITVTDVLLWLNKTFSYFKDL